MERQVDVSRRGFLGGVGALLVLAACGGSDGDGDRTASTSSSTRANAGDPRPLATTPDANGLLLPAGFTSRVIATSGQPVGDTGYVWPVNPDGGATFVDRKTRGGWYYVANSEMLANMGGVSAIRFAPDGEIVDAYRLVGDTNFNCGGGATPWGTWLTCEEVEGGRVLECDPTEPDRGREVLALGRFVHEAVAVDPRGRNLYLTEDRPDGLFYRFTPTRWPDLDDGVLEAVAVDATGAVTWRRVPDPTATTTPIRQQRFGATAFDGGEGVTFGDTRDGRRVWFATKGDNVVRELDPAAGRMREIYRAEAGSTLRGIDNVWWDEPAQRLFVAEDGDDMELVSLDRSGRTTPMLQVTGHDGSEIAGPALNPRRDTLFFSSQRGLPGTSAGITYAVTGPFPPT